MFLSKPAAVRTIVDVGYLQRATRAFAEGRAIGAERFRTAPLGGLNIECYFSLSKKLLRRFGRCQKNEKNSFVDSASDSRYGMPNSCIRNTFLTENGTVLGAYGAVRRQQPASKHR